MEDLARQLWTGALPDPMAPGRALAEIAEVDVVLDTFPYHGTTTTCDALSVGTPVVSLVGETPASRVSPSLLGEVGLGELSVSSRGAYVARLRELADGVAELRAGRVERVARYQASALSDASGLARALERVLPEREELLDSTEPLLRHLPPRTQALPAG